MSIWKVAPFRLAGGDDVEMGDEGIEEAMVEGGSKNVALGVLCVGV